MSSQSTPSSASGSRFKKIAELRVVDLRAELEKRGLDKTGVKAFLLERLVLAILDEGLNPDEYFERDDQKKTVAASPSSRPSARDDSLENLDADKDDSNDRTLTMDESAVSEERVAETSEIVVENVLSLAEATQVVKVDEVEGDEVVMLSPQPIEPKKVEMVDITEEKKHEDNETLNLAIDEDEQRLDLVATDKGESTGAGKEILVQDDNSGENEQGSEVTVADDRLDDNEQGSEVTVTKDSNENDSEGKDDSREDETALTSSMDTSGISDPGKLVIDDNYVAEGSISQDTSVETHDTPADQSMETKQKVESQPDVDSSLNLASDSSCNVAEEVEQKGASTGEVEDGVSDKTEDNGVTSGPQGTIIIVKGLSDRTRVSDIRTIFLEHGKIMGSRIIVNTTEDNTENRRFAQVIMSSEEEALKTIDLLNNTELHGNVIHLEKATKELADLFPSTCSEHSPRASGHSVKTSETSSRALSSSGRSNRDKGNSKTSTSTKESRRGKDKNEKDVEGTRRSRSSQPKDTKDEKETEKKPVEEGRKGRTDARPDIITTTRGQSSHSSRKTPPSSRSARKSSPSTRSFRPPPKGRASRNPADTRPVHRNPSPSSRPVRRSPTGSRRSTSRERRSDRDGNAWSRDGAQGRYGPGKTNFGSSTYRGNNFRGSNYRGNNFRGNQRGSTYRGNILRGNNYRGNSGGVSHGPHRGGSPSHSERYERDNSRPRRDNSPRRNISRPRRDTSHSRQDSSRPRYTMARKAPPRPDPDHLTFEKIRAAKIEERRKEDERKERERERLLQEELDRQREEMERRNAEAFEALQRDGEVLRLEAELLEKEKQEFREREKIRIERDSVQKEKEKLIRMEQERQTMEFQRIHEERDLLREAQLKLQRQRKRPFPEEAVRSREFSDHSKKPHLMPDNRFPAAAMEDSYVAHASSIPGPSRGHGSDRRAPMRDAPARDRVDSGAEWLRHTKEKSAREHRLKHPPAAPKISGMGKSEHNRQHVTSREMSRPGQDSSVFAIPRQPPMQGNVQDMSGRSVVPQVKERRYPELPKSDTTYSMNRDESFARRQPSTYPSLSQESLVAQDCWDLAARTGRADGPERWISGSGSTMGGGRPIPVAPPPPQGIYNQHNQGMSAGNNLYENERYDTYKQNARRY